MCCSWLGRRICLIRAGFCSKRRRLCTGRGGPAGVCSGFPLLSVAAVFVVIKNQAGVDVDTSECGRLQCLVVSTLVCVSLPVAEPQEAKHILV